VSEREDKQYPANGRYEEQGEDIVEKTTHHNWKERERERENISADL
jgi:hypothetical protein